MILFGKIVKGKSLHDKLSSIVVIVSKFNFILSRWHDFFSIDRQYKNFRDRKPKHAWLPSKAFNSLYFHNFSFIKAIKADGKLVL